MERCPDCGRTFASKERLSRCTFDRAPARRRSCVLARSRTALAPPRRRRGAPLNPQPPSPRSSSACRPGSLLRKGQDPYAADEAGEAAGEDPAPRRPSLLKRISSSSLLRSSKPAGGEGSARGGRGGGTASADGAGGGTGSARGASTAAKEQTAGDSARPGGGGRGRRAKVPGHARCSNAACLAPRRLGAWIVAQVSHTPARLSIPALPRALPRALCPLPFGSFWPWPLAVAQERLGELKELLDAELISQAEFDAQRADIIQSL